ncbi:MAG: twitching motility protein PilT [Eubacteriales bacterium]
MVQLIVGSKGEGKTLELLAKVNEEVNTISGNIVYLDKSTKHMYELNNKIRLINVKDYHITNSDEFIGFICGILSQDNDLQAIYCDSFLKIACLEGKDIEQSINKMVALGSEFKVNFVVSISVNEDSLSNGMKKLVVN